MELKETSKNKKYIGIIMFLILIIIGLAGYVAYDKLYSKPKNFNRNNNCKCKQEKCNNSLIKSEKIYDAKDNDIAEEVNIYGTKYNITVSTVKSKDTYGNSVENTVLKIDNKEIIKVLDIESLESVYVIGDLIAYEICGSDGSMTMTFVDTKGNLIKEISKFDEKMQIAQGKKATVENGIIKFDAEYENGPSLIKWKIEDENFVFDQNTIVQAMYEIEYLGNRKFSEYSIQNKLSFKDYLKNN